MQMIPLAFQFGGDLARVQDEIAAPPPQLRSVVNL